MAADELVVRVGLGKSARPAVDAGVRLVPADGSPVRTGTTGASGEVRFPRPAPGRYRVEVVADDHHDAVVEIDVAATGPAALEVNRLDAGRDRWLGVLIGVGLLAVVVVVAYFGRERAAEQPTTPGDRRSPGVLARPNRLRTGAALALALVALYGGSLPNDTRSEWFRTLARPDILPRELERLIPVIWLGLFLLSGLGLAAVWAADRSTRWKWAMGGLLVAQLALNYGYSYTFTMLRDIPAAFWVAVALAGVTAAVIAAAAAARAWLTAVCFVPYLAWVAFATYVTFLLARLNP